MWWEGCRFPDLVRWDNAGKVNMKQLFNEQYGGIHKKVPTVFDAYFTKGEAKHRLYVEYSAVKYNDFEDKYKYFPFPKTRRAANKFKNVLGWEYLNSADETAAE